MDKKILEDYIDACEFIKETEAEIKKLEKKKRFVQDKVRGSNPDWPYEERSFSLGGSVETVADAFTLAREKRILEEQRKVASDLKLGVEKWMKEIPFRMQRIIRYKFFNELTGKCLHVFFSLSFRHLIMLQHCANKRFFRLFFLK